MKKFIAALLAGLTLFTLVGCSGGSKADSSTPKDYSQIIHDARSDEDNEYDMIFTKGEDGKLKKAINFDLLRQMLSGDVVEGDEAYEFTWVGKKAAIVEANKPIRKTLRPCKEDSVCLLYTSPSPRD